MTTASGLDFEFTTEFSVPAPNAYRGSNPLAANKRKPEEALSYIVVLLKFIEGMFNYSNYVISPIVCLL